MKIIKLDTKWRLSKLLIVTVDQFETTRNFLYMTIDIYRTHFSLETPIYLLQCP
jgi:hypothetical protein